MHLLFGGLLLLLLSTSNIAFSQDLNQLHISEFLASNQNVIADEDDDFSDWIEIFNPTGQSIDLIGWNLSDNPDNLIKWVFPPVTIEANGYLLVYASGKDRRGNELHTNFKLSSSGESILLTAPDGMTIQHEIKFPPQYEDISFGYVNGVLEFLDKPTPGGPNFLGDFLSPPSFSAEHGFYEHQFDLHISSSVVDADIWYTADGSEPSSSNGIAFSSFIRIDSTMVIRAIVEKDGSASPVATKTYIFPDKVKNQTHQPTGYPSFWGTFSSISGNAPADYKMDPQICDDAAYKELIAPAMTSIPTLSISTHKDNFFSSSSNPETGGIYIHTAESSNALGHDWERPISMEYLLPDGEEGFQVDCGIRIHGGASRVPEKNPKHSFRVVFRNEYGPKELKYPIFDESATSSFNSLVLRAGFNQTWLHWDDTQRTRAQYINDSWVKDTYSKMGHISAHNKFVHLYINGLYWGLYNICERMDDDFMDYYLEGGESDFDVVKDYAELAEGNMDAWNEMMQMASEQLNDAESYYRIQGKDEFGKDDPNIDALLDVDNLIDYMLLNFYIGNRDWDHHNWIAARNRNEPGKGFQFFPWDSERTFNGLNDNVVDENNENRPSFLYSQLRQNPVFRTRFAQRANELLGPKGLLGPDSVALGWQARTDEIAMAIVAESARWGDYRRDLHSYRNAPYELYTKNDHWMKEQDRLMNDYFPKRSEIVLEQLKEIGLAGDIVTSDVDELGKSVTGQHTAFPNPFDQSFTIQLRLLDPGSVRIEICNNEGQLVSRLYNGIFHGQDLEVNWKPGGQSEGLYYYRIITDNTVHAGKMIYWK